MAKLNKNLLNILVCPVSKGKLVYDEENNELICEESKLAYPIIAVSYTHLTLPTRLLV